MKKQNQVPDSFSPVFSPEVEAARQSGRPLVALESTIISHGMPYPRNIETALAVEAAIRERGAVPATIAIVKGKLKVGLTPLELDAFGRSGRETIKCSRRDLPVLVAQGTTGATTVAATMIIAQLAGIPVFATGGIGGVHRGAAQTMDISADLQELARTNVAVVCAGAKAILDLGLTLEYLETQGVPVLGYKTRAFPAFYFRESGYSLGYSLESPLEIARVMEVKWALGLQGGIVVANPIPEGDALKYPGVEDAISTALKEAGEHGISGKDLTPFLLTRLEALTGGASLEANIRLVLHNAMLAAEVAVAFAEIRTRW